MGGKAIRVSLPVSPASAGDSPRVTRNNALTPKNLEVLEAIPATSVDIATETVHCARCHDEYFEAGNHSEACVIKCNEEPGEWENEELTVFVKTCCLEEVLDSDTSPDDICFKTSHTTNPREVKYFEGYYAKDEDKSVKACSSRNANVVTCKHKGCNVSRA
ncbi:hypothetical protein BDV93DRAFT_607955 [Ceratobasidium sp. AG-I]|nr:hypothetical protein BDV93DRAFT_607955 [Ceratobasidium sp. AG-I]